MAIDNEILFLYIVIVDGCAGFSEKSGGVGIMQFAKGEAKMYINRGGLPCE